MIRKLCFSLLITLMLSCSPEVPGIDISIPTGAAFWRYEIFELTEGEEISRGIVDVTNESVTAFEGEVDVLPQRRVFRYDSLRGTAQAAINKDVYFKNRDKEISIYVEDILGLFDQTLDNARIDTLAQRDLSGDPYQRFTDFFVGWTTPYRFKNNSTTSYQLHNNFEVFIDFDYEDSKFTGKVEVQSFANFIGIERVRTPFDSTILASKIKTTMAMVFDLVQDDTIQVTPFRNSLVMYDYFEEEYGLVKREREEFRLFIPTKVSSFPAAYHPGEKWEMLLFIPPFDD